MASGHNGCGTLDTNCEFETHRMTPRNSDTRTVQGDGDRAPGQPSLPGFDSAPQATDGLFFAVFPDAGVAANAARLASRLRDEHRLTGRPLAAGRLHVSLLHLGDYAGLPPSVVDTALAAAATVAMPPFEVGFDCAMSFAGTPGNRPLVLCAGDGVGALMVFQQALAAAMAKVGLGGRAKSSYVPHMTLLYDGRGVSPQLVETISWTVNEFVLVHSLLGRTQYFPLGRWPLWH